MGSASTGYSAPVLIFPAIDLMSARAVRLEQGRADTAKVYSEAPWELVAGFEAAGAARVHVVDLDAAFSGGSQHNRDTIARIVASTRLEVEVGGGIRDAAACEQLFAAGAHYAVLGTAAIRTPALVEDLCRRYPGRIVVAVDARNGKVAVAGWTEDTDASALDVGKRAAEAGAAAVLYTDIARDGMRTGPDLEATARLAAHIGPCPVIASGGVSQLDDLRGVKATGAGAVIIGKAIYEGVFTVAEAVALAARLDTEAPSTQS